MARAAAGRHALLLALLLAGLAAVVTVWLAVDRRPPEWDHANHLERALECHRILAEPGHDRVAEIIATSSFYPPLVLCATGLAYFVLPVTPLTAQLVMWGFLVAGTLAVWGLGRRLLDVEAGFLAAIMFATAPFVVFSLLRYQLDLPLASIVAIALYVLVRAQAFASLGWSLVLGVVLGVGMLIKPPFAAYLLPALIWSAWRAVRAPDRGARLVRLALALLVGALVAGPWYGPRLAGLPLQILNRSFKQAVESPPAMSSAGLAFYPRVFLPLVGVLTGLLAVWGAWAVRRMPRARALVWTALLPWGIFILIQNKNLRYALPLVPAVTLAAAAGLAALGPRVRRIVGAACVALGVLQVSGAAFGLPPAPPTRLFLVRSSWRIRPTRETGATATCSPPCCARCRLPRPGPVAASRWCRTTTTSRSRTSATRRSATVSPCASRGPGMARPSASTRPSSRRVIRGPTPPPRSPSASCATSRPTRGWPRPIPSRPSFRCPTAAAAWSACGGRRRSRR
jgi:4-amino-4-deoxy-L-arabinose transferase-like glycosyltransferase